LVIDGGRTWTERPAVKIWRSDKTDARAAAAATPAADIEPAPGVASVLGADLGITGDVVSAGPVRLDGRLEGDIRAPHLTVGAGARVSGRIEAETARIDGTVIGHLDVRDVLLSRTAKVTGDILHQNLSIESGAHVDGNFKRRQSQAAPDTGERPAAAAAPPIDTAKTAARR
jgi:cytoskeletal protein CcmA (bactofilin family)